MNEWKHWSSKKKGPYFATPEIVSDGYLSIMKTLGPEVVQLIIDGPTLKVVRWVQDDDWWFVWKEK